MNVFTYGSLMYPAVWQRVVYGNYKNEHASIEGYRRVGVNGEDYPMLVPAGQVIPVNGRVYFDVSEPDLQRLDEFEGNEYQRLALPIKLNNNSELIASVYIANQLGLKHALDSDWNAEWFEKHGLSRFCSNYLGYSRLD